MDSQYKKFNHAAGCSIWHLEWCTKYRYKMFQCKSFIKYVDVVLREVCDKNKIEIIVLNIQPDHVHIVVSLPRGMIDIRALQLLKGTTSFYLFRLSAVFRRRYPRGHLWSKGSFAATVGFAQLETVVNYVRNQGVEKNF